MVVADEVLAYLRVVIWPVLILAIVLLLRKQIISWLNSFAKLFDRDDVDAHAKFSAGGNELSLHIIAAAKQQLASAVSDSQLPDGEPTGPDPALPVAVTHTPVTQGGSPIDRIATAWDSVVAAVAQSAVNHPDALIIGKTGSTAAALALQRVIPASAATSVQVLDNLFEQVLRSAPQDVDYRAADAFVSLADQTLFRLGATKR